MEVAVLTEKFAEPLQTDKLEHVGLTGVDLLELLSRFQPIGAWRQDLVTGHSYWSPGLYDIFDLPRSQDPVNILVAFERYHEEDRAILAAAFEEALGRKTPFSFTLRIRAAEGYRLITCIGAYRRTDTGADEIYGLAWPDPHGNRKVRFGDAKSNHS